AGRAPEDLGPEAGDIEGAPGRADHLDGTAGQAEAQRPEGRPAAPVVEPVDPPPGPCPAPHTDGARHHFFWDGGEDGAALPPEARLWGRAVARGRHEDSCSTISVEGTRTPSRPSSSLGIASRIAPSGGARRSNARIIRASS